MKFFLLGESRFFLVKVCCFGMFVFVVLGFGFEVVVFYFCLLYIYVCGGYKFYWWGYLGFCILVLVNLYNFLRWLFKVNFVYFV